jgi:hypothetical protein
MALSSRNSLLTLFFFIGLSLLSLFCANVVFFVAADANGGRIDFLESQQFWFTYVITPYGSASSIIGMASAAAAGFIAFIFFRILFRNTGQGELFFFSLFLFSLLFETLRLAVFNGELLGVSSLPGVIISRIVFGGRMFGLLALLFSSLYSLDFLYQKFEIIVAAMTLLAFLLGLSLPFEPRLLLTDGLFRLSDEQGLFILCVSLVILIVVTNVITVFRGRTPSIPAGIVAMILAREMMLFALSPVALIGGGVLFIGGFVFTYLGYKAQFSIS